MLVFALIGQSAQADAWESASVDKIGISPTFLFCDDKAANGQLFSIYARLDRQRNVMKLGHYSESSHGWAEPLVSTISAAQSNHAATGGGLRLTAEFEGSSAQLTLSTVNGSWTTSELKLTRAGETLTLSCRAAPLPIGYDK